MSAFQVHCLLPLITFPYVLSPIPPFSFNFVPLGTTTNEFLPVSWQRDLPLSLLPVPKSHASIVSTLPS